MASADHLAVAGAVGPGVGEPGLWLVGEYLGTRDARVWTDKDGREHEPVDIRLLVGTRVETVQCSSRGLALMFVNGARERDLIAVPVRNRYGAKDGRVWQFYAAYGRVPDEDAS